MSMIDERINKELDITNFELSDHKTILDLLYYNDICYWWYINFNLSAYSQNKYDRAPIYQLYYKLTSKSNIINCMTDTTLYAISYIANKMSEKKIKYRVEDGGVLYRMIDWEWRKVDDKIKNEYHSDIVNILLDHDKVTSIYYFYKSKFSFAKQIINMHNKNMDPLLPATFDNLFWKFEYSKKKKLVVKHFHDVWDKIENAEEWYKLVGDVYNVDSKEMKAIIKHMVLNLIPDLVVRNSISENVISTLKPKVVVMRDEQTPSGKSLVHAARRHNIPTIGIQHGGIARHPAYLYHDPKDVALSNNKIRKSFPVPDVTCVWGQFEYDLLVNKAGYPAKQVIVTGNPRYDYLGHASEVFSRDEFCKRYDINPKNKIILWTTQSHGWSMDENHEYLKEVFDTCRSLSDVTLIIKQHPNEGEIYRNLIYQYVNDYKLNIQVIVPDRLSSTTEMVYVSDVIINKNSTTGQEAVALYKPMIILDYSSSPDYGDYVKEGVGIPVYEKGILKQEIENVLNNKYDVREAQDNYVRNHMYKIDGLASKRVADIVIKYLKN